MNTRINIISQTFPSDELHNSTLELLSAINRNSDVVAELHGNTPSDGDRGDTITIGSLALTFISSGAAVGLLEVFRAYFSRDESIEIELVSKSGSKIRLNSKNTNTKDLSEITELLKKHIE